MSFNVQNKSGFNAEIGVMRYFHVNTFLSIQKHKCCLLFWSSEWSEIGCLTLMCVASPFEIIFSYLRGGWSIFFHAFQMLRLVLVLSAVTCRTVAHSVIRCPQHPAGYKHTEAFSVPDHTRHLMLKEVRDSHLFTKNNFNYFLLGSRKP